MLAPGAGAGRRRWRRPASSTVDADRRRPGRGRGQTSERRRSSQHQLADRFVAGARPAPASGRRPGPGTGPGAAFACRLPSSICMRQVLHSVEPNSTRGRRSSSSIGRPAASDSRVVLRLQAEGAGHAGAAHVDCMHAQAGDQREQRRPGRRPAQRLQVAGHVMADATGRAAGNRCAAGPAGAGRHRKAVNSTVLLGDQPGVGVVEQVEVVLAQHQGGGRLGADDRVALAGQVGQDAQVVLRPSRGPSRRRRGPAAPCRSRAGRAARRRRCRCAAARRPSPRRSAGRCSWRRCRRSRRRAAGAERGLRRPAAPRGPPQEAAARRSAAAAAAATGRRASPAASATAGSASSALASRAKALPRRAKRLGAGQHPVGAVQAVLGDVGRLGLQHQLGDVDVGRAFAGAHLAVDAQVGDRAHVVGRRAARIGRRPAAGGAAGWPWPAAWRPRRAWRGRSGTCAAPAPRSGTGRSRCS